MKVDALVGRAVIGLLSLAGGCGRAGERVVEPAWLELGLGARQIEGRYHGLKIEIAMPVLEISVKKKLTNHLDLYGRLQFTGGALDVEHPILAGRASGDFEGIGLGLNYFPLATRFVGFGAGLEAFAAEYEMRGGLGPLKRSVSDRFRGGGFNLGLLGEIPLFESQSTRLIWGAGYGFSQTDARRASADLDGWYATVGIAIKLDH